MNILDLHLITVPGYQTDLVLQTRIEDERYNINISAADVCLPTLSYPGLGVNLVLKSDKCLLCTRAIRSLLRTERAKVIWQSHINIFLKNENMNLIRVRTRR